jgi:hypothetical protein
MPQHSIMNKIENQTQYHSVVPWRVRKTITLHAQFYSFPLAPYKRIVILSRIVKSKTIENVCARASLLVALAGNCISAMA